MSCFSVRHRQLHSRAVALPVYGVNNLNLHKRMSNCCVLVCHYVKGRWIHPFHLHRHAPSVLLPRRYCCRHAPAVRPGVVKSWERRLALRWTTVQLAGVLFTHDGWPVGTQTPHWTISIMSRTNEHSPSQQRDVSRPSDHPVVSAGFATLAVIPMTVAVGIWAAPRLGQRHREKRLLTVNRWPNAFMSPLWGHC